MFVFKKEKIIEKTLFFLKNICFGWYLCIWVGIWVVFVYLGCTAALEDEKANVVLDLRTMVDRAAGEIEEAEEAAGS